MQISDEGRRKQGRGTGDKETWKPWNLASDFPGKGRKMKALSHMFPPRHLQGQSKTEDDLLYMIEIADNIEQFKEQFNLPLEETKEIAAKLGIKHPLSRDEKSEVMTLDCVIFYKTGKPKAIDVKYFQEDQWESKKLKRDLEKLQIKKVWSEKNGFEWLLFTHSNVPKILITNVKTLRESFKYKDEKIGNYKEQYSKIDNSFSGSIGEVNEQISKALKIASSRGWKIFNHLCAHKLIRFNLNIPFNKKTAFSSFYLV